MSDTSSLVGVVPEVYYDLIGRVPPGVVFLGLLASDPRYLYPPLTPRDLSGSLVVSLLLLGYTVGILLGGVGTWIATGLWHLQWRRAARAPALRAQLDRFNGNLPRLYEYLCQIGQNRVVLNKLTAEVVLCANLLVAFALLLLMQVIGKASLISTRSLVLAGGAVFSAIGLWTRQHNATQRQCTLVLDGRVRSIDDAPAKGTPP